MVCLVVDIFVWFEYLLVVLGIIIGSIILIISIKLVLDVSVGVRRVIGVVDGIFLVDCFLLFFVWIDVGGWYIIVVIVWIWVKVFFLDCNIGESVVGSGD